MKGVEHMSLWELFKLAVMTILELLLIFGVPLLLLEVIIVFAQELIRKRRRKK